MKPLLVDLLLVCAGLTGLRAGTYYVSPMGSDAGSSGLSLQAPFKSIQKAAEVMRAGDTCMILAGTYRECVTVAASGTTAAPITFQAYGNASVVVDGTEVVTGWTNVSPNVHEAPMDWSLRDGNQVFQADAMQPEARWPNAGAAFPWQDSTMPHPTQSELGDWSYVDSAAYDANHQNGGFVDAQLPARADGYWNGATVHIVSGLGWIMQHPAVTGYASATKTLSTNDSNGVNSGLVIAPGNEYYLTGIKGEMDTAGEWFHDPATSRLCYYSATPPVNVRAKRRPYGFDLRGRSHIRLVNLGFFACTIQTDSASTHATFDGLSMRYLGHGQKDSPVFGLHLVNNSTLRNSDLGWDSRGLVYLGGSDIRVINNKLHDSGYVPFWDSIVSGFGYRNLVSHNTMCSAGRAIMGSPGRAAIVQFNDMSNAMRLTADGGVLYTYLDAGNTLFRYNLLHDSPGPAGHGGASVQGFYLDCLNSSWIVHHNVIWGLPGYAMQFNARQNFNMVFNNSCWNTAAGSIVTAGYQDGESGTRIHNNLWSGAPEGAFDTWRLTDWESNHYTDPGFVNPAARNFQLQAGSPAINQGTVIPGVTDGYVGAAPDLGALEGGAPDWTVDAGCQATPPSPEPVYDMPAQAFANKVNTGSFESGWLDPAIWTTAAGSNLTINSSPSWVSGFQGQSRSGYGGLKFGAGTSEIRQTVTGLQSGRRYKLYAGIQTADPSSKVYVGVRSYGYGNLETAVLDGTGGAWSMVVLPFVNGAASTSVEIYVKVISSSATVPVYVDDLGLVLAPDTADPQPYGMPFASYPFNESSGATASDASTHARNATLTNTSFVAGHHGNALGFNGASSYGSAGAVPSTAASFSVAFWVKFDDAGAGTPILASNNSGVALKKGWWIQANQNRSVGIYLWTRDNSQLTDDPATGITAWTPQMAPAGTWTHVAFTIDRKTGVLSGFRDGTLSAAIIIPEGFGDFDSLTGLRLGSTALKGQMDDFQMWDTALSTGAIRALANADASLALRLKLDETPGATKAWDATGNGHHGTLASMNATTSWVNGVLQFSALGNLQCPPLSAGASPGGSFSVALWVKFDAAGTGTPLLASNTNGSNTVKGWYIQASQNRSIGIGLKDATTAISMWHGQMTAPAGEWTHIAYTIDRENGLLSGYCNGVLRTSMPIPAGFGDVDTLYGPRLGSGPAFNGQLDDVRIYSRALGWWELQIPSKPLSGLQLFRAAYGLLDDGSQDPATPAGDGVSNLSKYAFNMLGAGPGQAAVLATPNVAVLPAAGSAGLPRVGIEPASGKLQLTYIRRKATSNSGLTYAVPFSNDLGLADPWAVNSSATEVVTAIDSSLERVTVTDSVSNPAGRFVRVRITSP